MKAAASISEPAALPDEALTVESLLTRLQVSDAWNVRLQSQLQELLKLPRSDVDDMRLQMQNPEVAIPLLQCYDAAIKERSDRVEQLEMEVMQLRSVVDARATRELEAANDLEVSDGLLRAVRSQAAEEVQREAEKTVALTEEVNRLRLEMRRSLEAGKEAEETASQLKARLASVQADLQRRTAEKSELEETLRASQSKAKQHRQAELEASLEGEAQTVRLQLLSRENEEKVEELEKLRSKMLQALRQTSDNHSAHLRMAEERHRLAVEDLRQVNRTHEMEITKLRAQLARLSPSQANSAHSSITTTSLLEAQARQAQDAEIKRLYASLSTAQQQRDEALDRLHNAKRSGQEREQGLEEDRRRELQGLQARVRELRAALDTKESDAVSQQSLLSASREELAAVRVTLDETTRDKDRLQREVAELKRSQEECQRRIAQLTQEQQQWGSREKELHTRLEERVGSAISDLRECSDRARAELAEVLKERDDLRSKLADAQRTSRQQQQTIARCQREHEVLDTQRGRLQEALAAHKQQLSECDAQLVQAKAQRESLQRQVREGVLESERLRMDLMYAQQRMKL